MEFFSEIYGCYYQIIASILENADTDTVSKQEIIDITERLGFAESVLTVPDRLFSGQWPFLEKLGANEYASRLENCPYMPLTFLQKRWLKSLFYDSRVSLFLDDSALAELGEALKDVEPLWNNDNFLYYDRYENGDHYSSPEYRQNFRKIVEAIRSEKAIHFDYISSKGKYTRKTCFPLKLEYSSKNDRFRLMALRSPFEKRSILDRYRLDGMKNVRLTDIQEKAKEHNGTPSLDSLMRQSYGTEPVRLLIKNKRNALERAMLHFANYDKDTKQLDEDTWECCIYYDSSMETELLIEILSFGPVVKVAGPETFVNLIRERLRRQLMLSQSL